jgi:peptidoglycan/xylan/chitin deacetylase (PgdA/CDA1 family)
MSFTHSIMFHHFNSNKHLPAQGSLSAEEFEEMLDWLGNRYNLVDAKEYLLRFEKNCLQSNDICLSFDDGLLCQFDVAVPVLRKRNIKAFFFVYSSVFTGNYGLLEIFRYFRTNCFDNIDDFYRLFFNAIKTDDESLYQSAYQAFKGLDYLTAFRFYSDNDRFFRYLRDQVLGVENYNSLMLDMMQRESFDIQDVSSLLWMKEENLKKLYKEGHLIGLHSYSHPTKMIKLTRVEQQDQYRKNMEHLEGLLGKGSVRSMSHPCGDYNADTLSLLTDMGIRIGFRSSLSVKEIKSPLEVPRDDHANIFREMSR